MFWAWPGVNEDCGVWFRGRSNPPPLLVKYVMGQRGRFTFSSPHRGNRNAFIAESPTQLLGVLIGSQVLKGLLPGLEGLQPRLLFKFWLRSWSILLPHVNAGIGHSTASLIFALLVVGALSVLAAPVTPVVALRAA